MTALKVLGPVLLLLGFLVAGAHLHGWVGTALIGVWMAGMLFLTLGPLIKGPKTIVAEKYLLTLLCKHYDGTLTDGELIIRLAELPLETIKLLPPTPPSYPPMPSGLRVTVLDQKARIEKGEATIIRGGTFRDSA